MARVRIGDVADHANRPAGGVGLHGGAEIEPSIRSTGRTHSTLFVERVAAAKVSVDRVGHSLPVVRMHEVE